MNSQIRRIFYSCFACVLLLPHSSPAVDGVYSFINVPMIDSAKPRPEYLSGRNIDPITNILARSRLAPNLDCELIAKKITQLRKFSTGEKYIEMIEVQFKTRPYDGKSTKAYFPVGSKLERFIKNSEFSGPVEEIRLYAGDRREQVMTVNYDGMGHITWAGYEDLFSSYPCGLK